MSQRILLVIAFFLMLNLSAQQESISSFNVITINYKHSSRIFAYAEGQLRGIKDFSYPDYYELKGGVGYQIAQNHKGLIGIGRYGNYQNHALEKEEFRIWLQDIIDVKIGKFKFENRLRAEKSWFYEPQKDLHTDRIRLRYRLNISVPLNAESVKPGTLFANTYDEIFLVTTDNPLFARNRIFGGFGYQIDEIFGIASGYLWQREFAKSGNKNAHFLYLALNITLDNSTDKNYNFPGAD